MKKIKYIFLIFSSIVIIGFLTIFPYRNNTKLDEKASTIKILPTAEGWEIYSKDNELLLELTRENTDSQSIETLNYIYETSMSGTGDTPDEYPKSNIKDIKNKQNNNSTIIKLASLK